MSCSTALHPHVALCVGITLVSSGMASVTSSCRDARSVRPLYQRLQGCCFNGDGRSDRASLQRVVPTVVVPVRPYIRLLIISLDSW